MSSDMNEDGQTTSGLFTAFRDKGAPTLYGENRTPVTVDVLEIGFVFAAFTLLLSLLLILPAFRGWIQKTLISVKIFLAIFVTLLIFLCNFGQEWEVAHISTKTAYRAGTKHEIHADIAVKIGLRSVNITLKGSPEFQQLSEHETEQVNYNERFYWSVNGWEQGRGGFGPFASAFNQEFREAQLRGAPYPILWIAEYFTIDGEGIRWGRYYRQAGFYAHIMLWLAFPCWILTMVLFQSVLFYGVIFCWLTAGCHFIACILFASIRNPFQLKIPFEDDTLEFSWGWSFHLCILNGLVCLILGIVVFFMDIKFPNEINTFFGHDSLNDFEEYYISANELHDLGIDIEPGTPSGQSTSTILASNGSATAFDDPGVSGISMKPIENGIKSENSLEDDDEDFEEPEVIRMFRRKSRGVSFHHLANKVRKTLHVPTKDEPINILTVVPRPKAARPPSSPYYGNVDASQNQNQTQNEEILYEDVETEQRTSKITWRVLPEGKTIRAKPRPIKPLPKQRNKNKNAI